MSEYEENVDFFEDGDLAEAENLPAGKRYIGYIAKVNVEQAQPGKFRQFDVANASAKLRKMLAGRTEVPQIDVEITALSPAFGEFAPESNYYKTSTKSFWVGKLDKIGRHSLARLITDVGGVSEEDLKTTPIIEAALKLEKAYVTFDVKHRTYVRSDGEEGKAQDFVKIKPATMEEIEQVQ